MQITNTSPSFGIKTDTVKILETTTLKMIQSETVTDLKPIVDTFWKTPLKAAGNRGYRYYLQHIGKEITDKYPEIADATENILQFLKNNPSKQKLQEFVEPIVEKLGKTIDITL